MSEARVRGDTLGLSIPAHAQALREGGAEFLTTAFRAFGALGTDNRVTRITRCEECPGGSTGRKLLLSLEYEQAAQSLHGDLFVKFSRDFDDPLRDRGRTQMAPECSFAQLSRVPGFPIAVPVCLFSDYHAASGTGLLITERIAFGRGGIELHRDKCLDDSLPQPVEHYAAILSALARLAGAHKAGRLPEHLVAQFPFDPAQLSVGERRSYNAGQLQRRVARYAEFVSRYPALLPEKIRAPAFIERLMEEVARFPQHETSIQHALASHADYVALSHWNANIDNAWFWRGAKGQLECGLLDWGCASQMNLAMAIWGSMSGGETELWDLHLDALLDLFINEFQRSGGPLLDVVLLKRQLMLYVALMGLAWLLDVPAYIQKRLPDLAENATRLDPRIRGDEAIRTQLQMLTNFLNLWQTQDFGRVLDEVLKSAH